MAKSREELKRQLKTFESDLGKYEAEMNKHLAAGNKKKAVDYAMAVAGLKNSIKELKKALEKM
jgi:KaiC/GvpD/RAD55 family RecA-like ATPase